MLSAFDNTGIKTGNLCRPLDYYSAAHTFQEQNTEYILIALEYSEKAVEACITTTGLSPKV